MVFSSLLFLYGFLPLCLLIVWLSRSIKVQNIALLIFSLIFYAWGEPILILLMLGTATFAWVMGLLMEKPGISDSGRKIILAVTVTVMLTSLGIFKYLGFFARTLDAIPGITLNIPVIGLPIGISFYTFQILTYVIDLYRGEAKLQTYWYKFLLYVSLFPQLIAGPIVRYTDVAAQIDKRQMTAQGVVAGINRFLVGLGKKVLLANNAGLVVSQVMEPGRLGNITALEAWMGVIGFAFQIYFDFSGYSDMAIGLGRMFGFEFKENFNYPYTAVSITDFWRRWHMSLSSFFRDYVYIPLGGNRRHQVRNMFIVWGLTGLWHGASWNFILWGLYFFGFLLLEKYVLKDSLKQLPRIAQQAYMALIVLGGWVLFYYTNLADAGRFTLRLFGAGGFVSEQSRTLAMNNLVLYLVCLAAMTPLVPRLRRWLAGKGLMQPSEIDAFSLPGSGAGEPSDAVPAALLPTDASVPPAAVAGVGIGILVLHSLLLFWATASLAGSSFNPFLYFRF